MAVRSKFGTTLGSAMPFNEFLGFTTEEQLPSVELPTRAPVLAEARPAAVDLRGRRKFVLNLGRGGTGKSAFARLLAETALSNGRNLVVFDCDPHNRTLSQYIQGVHQPEDDSPAATMRLIQHTLRYQRSQPSTNVLFDLGGGDVALRTLLQEVPNFAEMLAEWNIDLIALYFFGPRIDDLATLASYEKMTFRPAATALIFNEGLISPGVPREEAFRHLHAHSVIKSALSRGAVELYLPRLDAATMTTLEIRRLLFRMAADGQMPADREVLPLGVFERARLRQWLRAVDHEFEPIASWLP